MHFQDTDPQKWLAAIASLVVLPPWIWLAVRTKNCLEVITAHSIPFPKRVIWLTKILALIIGAGGLFGVATEFGVPWLLASMPSATVILIALGERVVHVIPPQPAQDASAYRCAWEQSRRLRSSYRRSLTWPGVAFLSLIIVLVLADSIPNAVQLGLFSTSIAALTVAGMAAGLKQLRLMRWACPRCGCAYRGLWGRPWMPKSCVHCGLPREGNPIESPHLDCQ